MEDQCENDDAADKKDHSGGEQRGFALRVCHAKTICVSTCLPEIVRAANS
jgi:hypothetical protein